MKAITGNSSDKRISQKNPKIQHVINQSNCISST